MAWTEEQQIAIEAYWGTNKPSGIDVYWNALTAAWNRAAFQRLEELGVLDDKVSWAEESSRRMAVAKRRLSDECDDYQRRRDAATDG